MTVSRRSKLMTARSKRWLVAINTRFEVYPVRGYVIDIGPRFFLLEVVNDRIWLDGFECFRISDVTGIEHEPHAKFAEAALKLRGQRTPRKPRIRITSVGDILDSASRTFPLVTIHREMSDPAVCHIGCVLAVTNNRVSLLEIDPDAIWEEAPTEYRLGDITRVGFGADYEDALHLVGGGARRGERSASSTRRRRGQ
jgi:hypothetical protein